jgi:hypothetical protein
MSRTTVLIVYFVLAIAQLWMLITTWKNDGFGAAFKLFFYGFLSALAVVISYDAGL